MFLSSLSKGLGHTTQHGHLIIGRSVTNKRKDFVQDQDVVPTGVGFSIDNGLVFAQRSFFVNDVVQLCFHIFDLRLERSDFVGIFRQFALTKTGLQVVQVVDHDALLFVQGRHLVVKNGLRLLFLFGWHGLVGRLNISIGQRGCASFVVGFSFFFPSSSFPFKFLLLNFPHVVLFVQGKC